MDTDKRLNSQITTLLSLIVGAVDDAKADHFLCSPEISPIIEEVLQAASKAVVIWPWKTDRTWINGRLELIRKNVDQYELTALEMLCLAEDIAADLEHLIPDDPICRSLIAPLHPGICKLTRRLDSTGSVYEATDNAGDKLRAIYKALRVKQGQFKTRKAA